MKKFFLTLFSTLLLANVAMAQKIDLSAPINPDPRVKIGKLDNGLTYYIRHNEYPKNVIEFRLAVNAGSNQENESQRGLAHFTEHMAFNGIEGFPGNTMIDKLQSLGVVFGADINAYTGFDQTVFMIPMPMDDPKNLDVGLRILRGWAHGLLFDHKEIDDERGVITEEWRMGLGASDRMQKKYWPILMKDSRYAERLPIGLLEVIQKFDYQLIKDFYHDWYRPDLQAIIVVGDVNVDEIEQKIKTMFGNIPMLENPRVKEKYPIGMNREPLVCVCTDKEAPGNNIMLIHKFPHFVKQNIGDLRKQLLIDLYNNMYDSRLEEMTQDPKCPFLGAAAGYSLLIGTTDIYGAQAACKENHILESIQALMKEDYRILKYGFLQTELDRAKESLLEQCERAANEVDKTESGRYANEYVANFLYGDPIPGAKREYNYAKKFMEGITLDEVNALSKTWITPENFVAIVMAPEKEGVSVPTEKEVLQTITDENLKKVTPYVDTYVDREIVDREALKAGSVTKTEDIPSIKAKKLTLSNGITVILKHTDFKNDEILFIAKSKGGKTLYGVDDLANLDFATQLIDRAGIADMDYNSLMKKMKSKLVGVTPYITLTSEFLSGVSAPKDLDFFFQYLNAFFTHPREDTAVYTLVMNEAKETIKMFSANPMYKFFGAFLNAATDHDPYQMNQLSFTPQYLDKVDYQRAVALYKERFANPADFVFTFVGNFDEKTMTDYLTLYLGSLTTDPDRKENFDASVLKPLSHDITREEVRAGSEAQSWLGLHFEQPYEYNARNNMILKEMGDALEIYLLKIVREKMGNVYSPMLQVIYDKYPVPSYQLLLMMSCSPDKVDVLSRTCFKILKDFQAKGPDKKTLEKVKKQLHSTREKEIQTNRFWLNYISNCDFRQDDFNCVNEYDNLVDSITKKEIVNFMKVNFKLDEYTRVDLYPDK